MQLKKDKNFKNRFVKRNHHFELFNCTTFLKNHLNSTEQTDGEKN